MSAPEPVTSATTTVDPVAQAAAFLDRLPKPEPEVAPEPEPETQEPSVLSLSYSQLSNYQECEWLWYLVSGLKTPEVPKIGGVVGSALHIAFANALVTYRDHETMPSDDGVISDAIDAFYLEAAALDPEDVYFDAKLMADNERRMVAIARAFAGYLRTLARRSSAPFKPVFVEEKFNIAHPEDASVRLRGVVDLVTERDGKYAGVDWKSGRWFTAENAKTSQQTESYLVGSARMAMSDEGRQKGWRQLSSFTYIVFPYDELDDKASAKAYVSQRTPRQIQTYLDTLSRVAREIRLKRPNESYKPHYSGACARCSVLHACERGQHWLKAKNIAIKPVMLVAPPRPARTDTGGNTTLEPEDDPAE